MEGRQASKYKTKIHAATKQSQTCNNARVNITMLIWRSRVGISSGWQVISQAVTCHGCDRVGITGTAAPMINLGDRWGWVVNATLRRIYSWEREWVPFFCRRLGGPQGQFTCVWRKYLACSGVRSPDRPARSESLCQLSYSSPSPTLPPNISLLM